jgi:hypothetical protein
VAGSKETASSVSPLAVAAAAAAASVAAFGAWWALWPRASPQPPPPSNVVARPTDSYVEESAMTRSQLESRYKMEKRIGQGGFGDVWLARDTRTGRRVAVKILPLDRLPRRMVEQEVRVATLPLLP